MRIVVPLEDGRLDVARLLREVCEAVHLTPPESLAGLTWSIDLGPARSEGRAQLDLLRRWTSGVLALDIAPDGATLVARPSPLCEAGRATADELRDLIAALLDDTPAMQPSDYGLFMVDAPDQRVPFSAYTARAPAPARMVVLVHGLDEPGWIWDDAIPALLHAGHAVARFEYPNDGPIAAAADRLAAALREVRAAGTMHVDLVAHSMGGLVSRDVLTREAHYVGDGRGSDELPAVDRLIMLGTPNHGSPFAHLRVLSEWRERAVRLLRGERGVTGSDDGDGQAGRDLLPGSPFLHDLNARPLPAHTRITIIAGRLAPLDEDDIRALIADATDALRSVDLPEWARDLGGDLHLDVDLTAADAALRAAVRGVGDGVVTLDSARLEGVEDIVIVEADHMGMLVNHLGDEVPPAVPIILDRIALDRIAPPDAGARP